MFSSEGNPFDGSLYPCFGRTFAVGKEFSPYSRDNWGPKGGWIRYSYWDYWKPQLMIWGVNCNNEAKPKSNDSGLKMIWSRLATSKRKLPFSVTTAMNIQKFVSRDLRNRLVSRHQTCLGTCFECLHSRNWLNATALESRNQSRNHSPRCRLDIRDPRRVSGNLPGPSLVSRYQIYIEVVIVTFSKSLRLSTDQLLFIIDIGHASVKEMMEVSTSSSNSSRFSPTSR